MKPLQLDTTLAGFCLQEVGFIVPAKVTAILRPGGAGLPRDAPECGSIDIAALWKEARLAGSYGLTRSHAEAAGEQC